jgi:hypothetical protein
MKTAQALPPYFQAREDYLRAMGRYDSHQKRLFTLFNVASAADLEQKLLENRHLYIEERLQFEVLGRKADQCADIYDQALIKQKQLIAQQQQFNADIAALDE